jgi:hypothetical protein
MNNGNPQMSEEFNIANQKFLRGLKLGDKVLLYNRANEEGVFATITDINSKSAKVEYRRHFHIGEPISHNKNNLTREKESVVINFDKGCVMWDEIYRLEQIILPYDHELAGKVREKNKRAAAIYFLQSIELELVDTFDLYTLAHTLAASVLKRPIRTDYIFDKFKKRALEWNKYKEG